ncbi:MAG: hypothetical protein AAF937_12270 [Planctomycetota bacterium]
MRYALSVAGASLAVSSAHADVITSPAAILANTAGSFSSTQVEDAFNGSGLTPTFESGVTDFDDYLALNPLHTNLFEGAEWFSRGPGSVDLDLGATLLITRLAIWNEEGDNGVGDLRVSVASDSSFSDLTEIGSFAPASNPVGLEYPAEVLDVTDTLGRFVRLEFVSADFDNFGLGEIAFATQIPAPSSALTLAALGIGITRRRRV